MSLPTERTEHFVLKEDGKIYWIEKMPATNVLYNQGMNMPGSYNEALQSAISNAVEVSNQDELINNMPVWFPATGKIYSLQCHVEKKEESSYEHVYLGQARRVVKTVALVTFSQPDTVKIPQNFETVLQVQTIINERDNSQPEREETQDGLLPMNFVRSITGWAKDDIKRKYEKWKETRKTP